MNLDVAGKIANRGKHTFLGRDRLRSEQSFFFFCTLSSSIMCIRGTIASHHSLTFENRQSSMAEGQVEDCSML